VMTAGAPVSPTVLRDFKMLLPESSEIHTPYGATEALPVTDICDQELLKIYENKQNLFQGICVGYPLKDIDLQIIAISDESIEFWENAQIMKTGEVGEIVVCGLNVSQEYLANEKANLKSKIFERGSEKRWHRTGDLGRLDEKGRIWFYGRKSQRVVTKNTTLFTIPCESVINQHPMVSRSALVGVKFQNEHVPVIYIEMVSGIKRTEKLRKELLDLSASNPVTKEIRIVLFLKKFPVDPRHNAKIFREKLAVWVQKQMR
ncbi:MAG TPA: AMP-binding protein, partial [Draconibacterium sp.]|nr:AMP-binding protein [Draconibacterium sp.]